MKIVYLIPGSGGGFYCENCMRDIPLINALKRQDVEVIMIPIYLPLFTDEESFIEDHDIFLGAVNLFLKYKYPALKRMPEWMSRFFNSAPVLKLAAKLSSSTEATSLKDMTMDMLTGDMPCIEKEIDRLVDFLTDSVKPDIIHISNALLIGLGISIKKRLRERGIISRLVCTLQDEHTWLDVMEEPYRTDGWNILKNSSTEIDLYFPVSCYYKKFMEERLGLSSGIFRVVHNGIDFRDYMGAVPASEPPVIGYLSRIHNGYGLDKLADIYIELKKSPGLENLRLRITGGYTGTDRRFVKTVRSKLKKHIKSGDVQFYKKFDIKNRIDFFSGLTLLSVPMDQPEAFGIYLLEAMASGVPVVQPDIGSFPEIVCRGSGGVYNPDDDGAMYETIRKILLQPEQTAARAEKTREHVMTNFSLDSVAGKLKDCYNELLCTEKNVLEDKCS